MKYFALLVIFWANLLNAENAAVKELTLLSSTKSYQADQPLILTVRFSLNPGWHIYAKEPGKFGLPTKLKLSTAAKIKQREWTYPPPEKFSELTGDETFGYQNQVEFNLEITPEYNFQRDLDLVVAVKWLACNQELCVPEERSLELQLPYKASLK